MVRASVSLLFGSLLWISPARALAAPPSGTSDSEHTTSDRPGGLSKWMINDKDPSSSLPNVEQRNHDPLNFGYHLMDLADKADVAIQHGDYRQAAKYYEAMAKAVPDTAIGFRKACELWEKAHDPQKALGFCRDALSVQGVTLGDYEHFAKLVLAKEGQLNKSEVAELTQVIEHLKTTGAGGGLAAELQCEVGLRLEAVDRLKECTAVLAQLAPNDPRTISYQWALALKQGDFKKAEELVERAKTTTMEPEGIKKMQEAIVLERSLPRRIERHSNLIAFGAIVIAALGAALGITKLLRRRAARLRPAASS